MRIRLQSINGKICNPLFNERECEEAIEKAEKDGIDLLVFPLNSIASVTGDSVKESGTYRDSLKKAMKRFCERESASKVTVCLSGDFIWKSDRCNSSDLDIIIDNSPEIETLEKSHIREKEAIVKSFERQCLYIVCKGSGTESVCKGIFSNHKIIACKGEILQASFDSDKLDFDTADLLDLEQLPYLWEFARYDTDDFFYRVFDMQARGLIKKMESMGRSKICLGVSGGLDSTVSLLVCWKAFKKYGLDPKNIIGVTMPGLGTTERTHSIALRLMDALGVSKEEIDLRPLLKEHLVNIKQPEGKFDVTFEQCQSRERTQVLLDIANRDNAIMIGTGCMSEFALGWMTYGGDHLSMYAINIGLPKTVVKMYATFLRDWMAGTDTAAIIQEVCDSPVSPELLPLDENGEQKEKTESIIGDYTVLDFYIYYMTKGYSLTAILAKAESAFGSQYSKATLLGWLKTASMRFFTRAYKKNCYGDGLQLLSYSASPDSFHIPSDIDYSIWEEEIESLEKEISE